MPSTVSDTGPRLTGLRKRFAMALDGVRRMGLLERKTESVAVRINPDLLRLAKDRTGVEGNSALMELAIANLVMEDGFPEAFARSRGTVPNDLELGI